MIRFLFILLILLLAFSAYPQNEIKSIIFSDMNEYRGIMKIKPMEEDSILIKTLKRITNHNYNKYIANNDSLREILNSCHNFDYYVTLVKVECNNINKSNFNEIINSNAEFTKVISDSLVNKVAISTINENGKYYLFILATQHYIQFSPTFNGGFSIISAGNSGEMSPVKYHWLSYEGRVPDKKPSSYVLFNNEQIQENEIDFLNRKVIEIDENGDFKIFIDYKQPENSNINTLLIFDSKNRKVARIKM